MKQLYEIYRAMDKLCGTRLLTESQESKSIDQAKTLYMQRIGCTREEADDFVRNKLRADIPSLRGDKGGKFILGATRMFLDKQLYDAPTIGAFNDTIKYVVDKGYSDKFKKDLNGLSAQEFIAQFQQERQEDFDNESEKLNNIYGNNTDTSKSRYQVVPINEFEDAEMYADYCDWCITYDPGMFKQYGCDGVNQIYFCIKNGFEDVPREQGVNCPLDEYGLSMISVIVNPNGSLANSTCRWNHKNEGNDHIMSMSQISELVGCNFRNVFPPNNKFANAVQEAQQRLANGEHPRDVFEHIGSFNDGLAMVRLKGKWNYINTEGRILSNDWFDRVYFFYDGLAQVELNDKSNFINKEGRILSKQWFDETFEFYNGYAVVGLKRKYNLVNTEGHILSNDWFDWVNNFHDGWAGVMVNGKYNFINTEGQYLSDTWFDDAVSFSNGWARVRLNGKWNYLRQDGHILSDTWFDYVHYFSNGYAGVKLKGNWFKIDTEGNLYDRETGESIR